MSQTPVREALQSLRADDMVRALPRRGYVVAPMARGDVADLFAAQAHLTGELAARAAAAAGPADLAALREHDAEVGRLVQACDAGGDPDDVGLALAHAEHDFHAAVNRTADSRKLAWLAGCAERYLPPRFYTASAAWRTATRRSHTAPDRARPGRRRRGRPRRHGPPRPRRTRPAARPPRRHRILRTH